MISGPEFTNDPPKDAASVEPGLRGALIYSPSSHIGGSTVPSRLMAVAAVYPIRFDQSDFARQVGVSITSVSNAGLFLRSKGWLSGRTRGGDHRGGDRYDLFATQSFWNNRQVIDEAILGLDSEISDIYKGACEAFSEDQRETGAKNQQPNLRTRSAWVGSIAVLGGVCDPEQFGRWLPGTKGWDLLVRTHVPILQK